MNPYFENQNIIKSLSKSSPNSETIYQEKSTILISYLDIKEFIYYAMFNKLINTYICTQYNNVDLVRFSENHCLQSPTTFKTLG